MIPRYTSPEMGALWSPETKFATWLEIELLAAEAQSRLGRIPEAAVRRLRERARVGSVARIDEIEERETRHDVVAFLRVVGETVGDDARYLHLGLGSSDVVDTALSVLMVRAADLIGASLGRLHRALAALAQKHRYTIMAGRTHGVHAEPVTFGLKAALWYAEVGRGLDRIRRAREVIGVGKISGEVGTFAHTPPEVEAFVCERLGLQPAPASSQVIQRDRHAEYLAHLAVVAGTLEKIATEIRQLARTELREVEEPFREGQTGSSAMPHKRNPVLCERVTGLSRVVRGHAVAALENIALWGERDITHSSAERVIIPDATSLLDYMARTLAGVIEGLRVYPDHMRQNLDRSGGLVFSHRVLLALLDRGRSREEAYRIVQSAAMRAWEEQGGFRELLRASGGLSDAELDVCFDPSYALRHVDEIFARVGLGERPAVPAGGQADRESKARRGGSADA
ncbi:MAG TPA: adenylosuccinate lyase [bacterium]|nr:adenylosuccinate lyase [bacterium]